ILRRDGQLIQLRPKVLRVLTYLLEHYDRVVTKQELCKEVWPRQHISDATLESTLRAVRQAIGDRGRSPRFIRTVYGSGYRFVTAVETRPHDETPPALRTGPDASFPVIPSGQQQLVTMLCCSLTNALALSAHTGPDTFYSIMRMVWDRAHTEVHRHGGALLYVTGESLMAMFGAALDEADHAHRAVLAALGLHQALHDYGDTLWHVATAGLEVRLGLHTGPVLVSRVSDEPGSPTVVLGDTAILAAFIEQAAAPGTLLCSDTTAGYAQEVGDMEAVRQLWVEGRSTPLMLYRILTSVPVSR
ncbi:MAG TPA: winged helix-turn-helix domain-containing protein, partial [Candidatus Tectomicrobia bacterium]